MTATDHVLAPLQRLARRMLGALDLGDLTDDEDDEVEE